MVPEQQQNNNNTMKYLIESLPYKPSTRVYFIFMDCIHCGVVEEIKIKLRYPQGSTEIEETGTWVIRSGTSKYNVEMENIAVEFESIHERAMEKCKSFKRVFDYANVKEVF